MSSYPQSVNGPCVASPRPGAHRKARRNLSRGLLGDASFSTFSDSQRASRASRRACLLHVDFGRRSRTDDAPFREFVELAKASGVEIRGLYRVHRERPTPRYFIGSGKAAQIRDDFKQSGVRLLIVNHDLSPSQERNLERLCRARVLGRSGLILDIFSRRARSHEGKLQVELAQLNYLSTRLVRGWSHLERQKGGIGLRGPGEKQLETDRRLISRRVAEIDKRLGRIESRRRLGRRMRRKNRLVTIALVGYTNAGKTTLFNRLTASTAYSADRMFATLDPVMRRLRLDGSPGRGTGEVILSDTVGFISNLPHTLVEAFNATLLEVREAELLLHVVDAAAAEHAEHRREVEDVLRVIGADRIPALLVFNKSDLVRRAPAIARDEEGRPVSVSLSARTGEGVDALRRALVELAAPRLQLYEARIPGGAGRLRSFAYTVGEVVREEYSCNRGWRLQLRLADAAAGSLLKRAAGLGCALELSEL